MSSSPDSSRRTGGPPGNQFVPGISGNPRGRPKGKKNKGTIVRNIAQETHVVKVGGQSRSLTHAELIFMVLQKRALEGDRSSAKLLDKYRDQFSSSENQFPDCGFLVVPEAYTEETTPLPIEDVEDDDDPVKCGGLVWRSADD